MKWKKLEIMLIILIIVNGAGFWVFKSFRHHPYTLTSLTMTSEQLMLMCGKVSQLF